MIIVRWQRNGMALAALSCGALLSLAPMFAGAAEPADRAALEKQLQEARAELDAAAREVAELSRQLHGGEDADLMRFVNGKPQGAMLGINIEDAGEHQDGVKVAGVSPGGPADAAGLKAGDLVVAIDGQALRRTADRDPSAQLVGFMRGVQPGKTVTVDYVRDGKRGSVAVKTAPAEPPMLRMLRERLPMQLHEGLAWPDFETLLGPGRAFRSLELVPVTPKLGQYFGTDRGLLVVRAPEGSGLPLEEGDVLLSIDGRAPENPGHAFRILRSYQPGEKVKLGVLRNRKRLELEATLPVPDAATRAPPRAPQPPRPPAPAGPA